MKKQTKEEYDCCICGKHCIGYGNNPDPVKHSGRCCDNCNLAEVIPARIKDMEDLK